MYRYLLVIIFIFSLVTVAHVSAGPAPVPPPAPASGNNQVASRDAIAVRVVPNPEHYSPLQWYNSNIKIKGAPQSLIVDGYEAVRDGRTVYVNAAKVARIKRCNGTGPVCTRNAECGIINPPGGGGTLLPRFLVETAFAASCIESQNPELYTNIYIISYNQQPEAATTDIFGQLLQFWKFNTDIKNCSSNPNQLCSEDIECGNNNNNNNNSTGSSICQPTGKCSVTTTRACLLDSDCSESESCRNKKSAIIHDVRRLADMRAIRDRLDVYNGVQKTYPVLAQGTYVSNGSVSTWPSWNDTFKNTIGQLPVDPVNKMGACPANFNPATCWDEAEKRYAAVSNPLAVPAGSYVYYYQYKASANSYSFCGSTESGFVQGKTVGSSICQCSGCFNRSCGDDGCGRSCGNCANGSVCTKGKCSGSGAGS